MEMDMEMENGMEWNEMAVCHLLLFPNYITQMYQGSFTATSHTARVCLGYVSIRPGVFCGKWVLGTPQESSLRGPVCKKNMK